MNNVKYLVFILLFCGIGREFSSAQHWLIINQNDSKSVYLRLDYIPSSPRNETQFREIYTSKEAAKLKKEYKYETMPLYLYETFCFPNTFDHYAIRSYKLYDVSEQLLLESFHGFLTFDTIWGGNIRRYARWSCLLKRYGADACRYASQTKYNNIHDEWVKFSENEKLIRYIRVGLSNEDSLAMFKVVYKSDFAKKIQKEYEFKELPTSRIFVYKISNGGEAYTELAETWYGKKGAITPIWLYPFSDPEVIESDVYRLYAKFALALFEFGKEGVIEMSNNLSAK